MKTVFQSLDEFPVFDLAHLPTPIEELPNLGADLGLQLYIKRDDCTGLAMGGNKARQLEYYLGDARRRNSDTILITGAVQSNYVRMAAAAANKASMKCHIQLEERVEGKGHIYRNSGNVLLDKLLGANLHSFPAGEDETAADSELEKIAGQLRTQGKRPYVIHLGADHPPLGALGYVRAADEIVAQLEAMGTDIDHIVVASGSGHTHSGLLFGLCCLGKVIPVTGVCVRRSAQLQKPRIKHITDGISRLLKTDNVVCETRIRLYDGTLAPGYGQLNDHVHKAVRDLARREGILVDPVYTGKTLAGLMRLVQESRIDQGGRVLFIHTGGTPSIFAYEKELAGQPGQRS